MTTKALSCESHKTPGINICPEARVLFPFANHFRVLLLCLFIYSMTLTPLQASNLRKKCDSLEACLKQMDGRYNLQVLAELASLYQEISYSKSMAKSELLFQEATKTLDTVFIIEGLYQLARNAFLNADYETSKNLYLKAADLSKALQDDNFRASVYTRAAQSLMKASQPEDGLAFFEKAWSIYGQNGNTTGQVTVMISLAGEYYQLKFFGESIKLYHLCKNILLPGRRTYSAAQTYRYYAISKSLTGKPAEALEYATLATQIFDELNLHLRMAQMTRVYGQIYFEMGLTEKAINYLTEKAHDVHEMGYLLEASYIYNQLAHYLQQNEQHARALDYQRKALTLRESIGYNNPLISAYINYGDALNKAGLNDSVSFYLNKGLTLAQNKMLQPDIMRAYTKLGEFHEKNARFQASLEFFKMAYDIEANEALQSTKRLKHLLTLKIKSQEYMERVSRLKDIEQNQKLILVALIVLVMFMATAIVVYFHNRKRESNVRMLELKQKLIVTQLNPSFIFSALSAIKGLIHSNQDEEAGKYLSGFARLIREVLVSPQIDYHLLEKETEIMRNYLELQKIRYGILFSFAINKEESIYHGRNVIPPFLIYPIIDAFFNSIPGNMEHPFGMKVNFSLTGNYLLQTCQFILPVLPKKQQNRAAYFDGADQAIKLIEERIRLLNSESGRNFYYFKTIPDKSTKESRITFEIGTPSLGLSHL